METLFLLSGGVRTNRLIELVYGAGHELRRLAQPWFERMRQCGPDVLELLNDGRPTACVAGAPFAYVGAFAAHVGFGFFYGADLDYPADLLEETGK